MENENEIKKISKEAVDENAEVSFMLDEDDIRDLIREQSEQG